ncbi:hypothetical protein MLA2C4_19700 [Bacillus mobilis]|nr:hypothetical protein MLA2C4_19700 [Bacillus mobilis]PGT80024.1 hypothetical protein COD14_02710 [Bacillus cereus]PGV97880.1 hypothetical protein COD86_06095 [Bacillus cereus]
MQKNYIKKERLITIAPFYFTLYFIKITGTIFSLWSVSLHNPLKHLLQLISRMMYKNRSSVRACVWVCCCT